MKVGKLFVALAATALMGLTIVGCTQQQVVVVAQQAGVASIVTWISVDNPTDAQKAVAAQVITIVKSNAASVTAGASYFMTLNPVLNEYITKLVPLQSQPIAKLSGGWVLTGIDTFFAMYPKYATNATYALQIVNSFCDGAEMGLAMSKDDPVIKAATQGAKERAVVRRSLR